ncbi:sensor histidine kinase [Prauserella muralis]|uniref:Histidine kinase n=1 Tax=Prauserella muralis TaxID=588067 RepID=A0A2V4BA35_9PSEU|nr:histidine kinase [Prauserella muralis]PXY32120.1 histidine kinase [Prauserella muralis]TWE24230.1 two-component system sensor histidine kinase DesK [Prauserella muralis]
MTEATIALEGRRIHRLRRYTLWTLVTTSVFVLMPVLPATGGLALPVLVPLSAAAVVSGVQRVRLVHQAVRDTGHPGGPRAEHVVTVAVALLAWGAGVALDPAPVTWAFLPALVGGAVVLNLPSRWRVRAALLVSVLVALVCFAATPLRDAAGGPWFPWLVAALALGITAFLTLVDVAQLWFWDAVVEVDRARAANEELAVARERLRFASDLHDIQGHHLQAIMLKGELTERLIGHDDEAARAHATELTELARTALRDTRRVVRGYRTTSLDTEITNAVELLGAAGIEMEVRGTLGAVPPPLQDLFGALVREGTTNILRHSQARRCELALDTEGPVARVRLANDGTSAHPDPAGSGIAGLRERFATLGGEVSARPSGEGWFELCGTARKPGGGDA